MLVIGITGPLGSGVSTTASALVNHGDFLRVPFSRAIRETAGELPSEGVRVHLQNIGNAGRETDFAHWAKVAEQAIPEGTKKDIVFDGIRHPMEARYLRDRFGTKFFLIATHASASRRWERVSEEYNGNQAAFKRDDARDQTEGVPHGQKVSKCVQEADFVLVNEETKPGVDNQERYVFDQLKEALDLMRTAYDSEAQPARKALPDEVHMATAYSTSQMSRCLKRLVGAIIVDENNLALSLGYNENPIGMKPCEFEYGYCFKDAMMEQSLEALSDLFCPRCGKKIEKLEKPYGCPECQFNLKAKFFPGRNIHLCTAIHAEERAIRSLRGSAEGATIFTTTFPCFQCSRYIVDARIKKVVYVEAYPVIEAQEFLKGNDVQVEPFEGFKARAFNLIFKQVS